MVCEVESMIIDSDNRDEPDTCGDCIFFTGEECGGTKHEGNETYCDSTICDEFEPSLNA